VHVFTCMCACEFLVKEGSVCMCSRVCVHVRFGERRICVHVFTCMCACEFLHLSP
jgi:hypothetical protein